MLDVAVKPLPHQTTEGVTPAGTGWLDRSVPSPCKTPTIVSSELPLVSTPTRTSSPALPPNAATAGLGIDPSCARTAPAATNTWAFASVHDRATGGVAREGRSYALKVDRAGVWSASAPSRVRTVDLPLPSRSTTACTSCPGIAAMGVPAAASTMRVVHVCAAPSHCETTSSSLPSPSRSATAPSTVANCADSETVVETADDQRVVSAPP